MERNVRVLTHGEDYAGSCKAESLNSWNNTEAAPAGLH